ncbi:MAG: porin, partial [Chthonomonadales bacterium]|nr:porin [Chthonomonadales bacterium]
MSLRLGRLGWLPVMCKNRAVLTLLISAGALVPQLSGAQTPDPGKKETQQAQGKDDKKQDDKKSETPVKAPDAAPDDDDKKKKEGKPIPAISPDARFDAQGEATFILQNMDRFFSKYEGENSLRSRQETELSHSYTYFLGMRVVQNVEVYINPEVAWGNGIGEGEGLSAGSNGDLLGQSELRPYPYLARYFVRWRIPMKHIGSHHGKEEGAGERTGRDLNVIAGTIPSHRIVLSVGKMAIND